MGRLIDADRLKAHYCWWAGGSKEMTVDEAKRIFDTIIDVQPTVDIDAITEIHEKIGYDKGFRDGYAQATSEVRRGHWIFNPKDAVELMFTLPKCSECGAESSDGGNYCPNCGADMREVEEDANK